MRAFAALVLITTLTACSKQEPAPAAPVHPETVAGVAAPGGSSPNGGHRPPLQPEPSPAAAPDGAALFASTCATCHMADGSGVPFLQPSIKGSAWIANPDPQLLLSLILRGSAILGDASQAYENDMAPQEHLTDAEIAAVATYVRTRFATPPIEKPVTAAEVAVARARPGLPE